MNNFGKENGRWELDKAKSWYESKHWLCGFNYLPSTAVNSTEMWQDMTFDPDRIDLELGWAEKIGFNSCRVFLQYLVWDADPDGFLSRLDRFLTIADSHKIITMPILFDDCAFAGRDPYLGPQDEPVPGVHNSQWTPSPGRKHRDDQSSWARLEEYVTSVVSRFARDERVVVWDLYNEPLNEENSLPLMRETFQWTKAAKPIQPLTVCQWNTKTPELDEAIRKMSDVISFHDYGDFEFIKGHVKSLEETEEGRPIICTEWMSRTTNSRFETHLPFFREKNVGCYCWGFVKGRTQTYYPWGSPKGAPEPKMWHHDVVDKDGKCYSEEEIAIIRQCVAQ